MTSQRKVITSGGKRRNTLMSCGWVTPCLSCRNHLIFCDDGAYKSPVASSPHVSYEDQRRYRKSVLATVNAGSGRSFLARHVEGVQGVGARRAGGLVSRACEVGLNQGVTKSSLRRIRTSRPSMNSRAVSRWPKRLRHAVYARANLLTDLWISSGCWCRVDAMTRRSV
jgi:hypothetical protein